MGRPSLPAITVFPAHVFLQNWPLTHEEEGPVSAPLGPEWTPVDASVQTMVDMTQDV